MPGVATILHADMDAFYAAVEQRDQPALRGQPVIVGGLGRRGVVSTCSYEARAFGVHSAQPTAVARRLCPHGVFLTTRMEHYVGVSRQVRAIFDRYTDLVEPLSLDEAFLDVSGSLRLFGEGPEIAADLRARVLAATGLTVSVGVASCKYVAKVASDLEKPDGLTVVPRGQEAAFLAALPVARLWGAGSVTQKRFQDLGWNTIGDLQRQGEAALVSLLGPNAGRHYHALAHGLDERSVVPGREAKSISREVTFAEDVVDTQILHGVLLEHAEDVGRRLRKAGLAGRVVRLKLRYPPFETHTRQVALSSATQDDALIFRTGRDLLEAVRKAREPVRLLGLGVADMQPEGAVSQGELFAETPTGDEVNQTLDAIRDRFGAGSAHRLGPGSQGADKRSS